MFYSRTIQNYKEKAKCFINQYNKYHVKQINKTVRCFFNYSLFFLRHLFEDNN
jgi:hypothetical protein